MLQFLCYEPSLTTLVESLVGRRVTIPTARWLTTGYLRIDRGQLIPIREAPADWKSPVQKVVASQRIGDGYRSVTVICSDLTEWLVVHEYTIPLIHVCRQLAEVGDAVSYLSEAASYLDLLAPPCCYVCPHLVYQYGRCTDWSKYTRNRRRYCQNHYASRDGRER